MRTSAITLLLAITVTLNGCATKPNAIAIDKFEAATAFADNASEEPKRELPKQAEPTLYLVYELMRFFLR